MGGKARKWNKQNASYRTYFIKQNYATSQEEIWLQWGQVGKYNVHIIGQRIVRPMFSNNYDMVIIQYVDSLTTGNRCNIYSENNY